MSSLLASFQSTQGWQTPEQRSEGLQGERGPPLLCPGEETEARGAMW